MFNQIGGKVKTAAWFVLCIGAVAVTIFGVMKITGGLVLSGILMLVCGLAASLLGAWVVYAIGETAEHVRLLHEENTQLRLQNEALVAELAERHVIPRELPMPEVQPEVPVPVKEKKKDKKDDKKDDKVKKDKKNDSKKSAATDTKKQPGIASDILSYALRFNTTDGMKAYLVRAAQTSNPAVEVLRPLLTVPDDKLREEAEKLMKKL